MTWHFPLTKSVSFTSPPFFEVKELLIFKSSYFRDSLAMLRDLTSPVNYRFLLSFPYVLHFCVCMYACMFASVWAGTYTHRVCAGRGQRLTLGVFLNHSTPYPACIWLVLSAILLLGFPVSALLWGGCGEATMPAWRFLHGSPRSALPVYMVITCIVSSAPHCIFWRET